MTMTAIAVTPQTFSTITQQLPELALPNLRRTYEAALDNNETAYVLVSTDPQKDKVSNAVGVTDEYMLRRYCAYDTAKINHEFTEIVIAL